MKNIFYALLIIGQISVAQNKTEKDTTKIQELENVIVTANRSAALRKDVPIAISKLTQKMINETKPTAVSEIVNKTPGVLMVNLGNEQHSMSIRLPMTTNSYYLYLEDGLPIRPMGIFNHNALLEINQFNIQNIEVVKGPTSSIYGPEAIGGTINFISVRPPLDTEFKLGIQSDQWGFKRLLVSGGSTIGKFGFHIAGLSSIQTNSWMTFSDYKKDNLNMRFEYAFTPKTRLISNTMIGNYYSDMSGSVNEAAFNNKTYTSTTDFTYRKSEALRTRLTLEHEWNENSNSFVTTYYRDNKLGQNPSYGIRWNPKASATNDPAKAKGEINSNNFKSYGVITQHNQNFNFLDLKLIGGIQYDYSPVNYWAYQTDLKANLNTGGQTVNYYELLAERPDLKLADYTADIYNSAEYIQLNFNPIQSITITAGARYDNMKINYNNSLDKSIGTKTYNQPTFKGGVNYNPIQEVGFYSNYSQGFAPPGVTSIFRKKPNTNPAEFYYNLEPATFNSYEIGGWVSILKNKLSFNYALYYMEGKNELLNIRQPDNSYDYQSAGETLHKGIEFGFNYNPSSQLGIRIGGTTSRHIFVDFQVSDKPSDPIQNLNGYEMPAAPKWIGNSEISYYPKWVPNLRASVEWQYVSSWYLNQINTAQYDGYNLFNGRIGYTYKSIELYANIINLTDELYATNVSQGNNTTDKPTFTAAAPRTFMIGLMYNLSIKK
jgi:iron complex outermembrane receptor protein